MQINFHSALPEDFTWLNPPHDFRIDNGLTITTDPKTDFWQRTHYGFRTDNGHALLTPVSHDFRLLTSVQFWPQQRYDQCGLLVRIDSENWIKLSTEYESARSSMLGSVVTNSGYSDWATTELDGDPGQMWYQISRNGSDFLLQASPDARHWQQLRITHLSAALDDLRIGIYACSPLDGRFTCTFSILEIEESSWRIT